MHILKKIRVSSGTAKVLELLNIKSDADPTTAYILIDGDCENKCSFCVQTSGKKHRLSRITWPEYETIEVLKKIKQKYEQKFIKRICFQVVKSANWQDKLEKALFQLNKIIKNIPISLSAFFENLDSIEKFKKFNIDFFTISLDCISAKNFNHIKKSNFKTKLNFLIEAAKIFKNKIATHLIIGLGETEKEIIQLLFKLKKYSITTGLFAFTPIPGTKLNNLSPPDLTFYRKIQIIFYLINNNIIKKTDILLKNDYIEKIIIDKQIILNIIKTGLPFITTGCKNCNRPFYNERPGKEPYNFPFLPDKKNILKITNDLKDFLKICNDKKLAINNR